MGGTFAEEFSNVAHTSAPGLKSVWDRIAAIGNDLGDVIRHQDANPLFQGLGGILAFALAWSTLPTMLPSGGNGVLGRTMRGLLTVGLAGLAGMSAAAGIGMVRDDGPGDNRARHKPETPRWRDRSHALPTMRFRG